MSAQKPSRSLIVYLINNMWEKIKGLTSSLRFWVLTLTLIISELKLVEASGSNFKFSDAFDYIQVYLVAIAAMRTADKASFAVGSALAGK